MHCVVRVQFVVSRRTCKDGVPYPVDRAALDDAIEVIRQGIQQSRVGDREKLRALQRLLKLDLKARSKILLLGEHECTPT